VDSPGGAASANIRHRNPAPGFCYSDDSAQDALTTLKLFALAPGVRGALSRASQLRGARQGQAPGVRGALSRASQLRGARQGLGEGIRIGTWPGGGTMIVGL
jgi:hypothetical protein